MNTQMDLLLIEEFSEQELEAISGGANNNAGLVVVNVEDNEILNNVNVAANLAVLSVARQSAIAR